MKQTEDRSRQEESERINAAISEFDSIVELAKGGAASLEKLEQIHERLKHLNGQLADVKKVVETAEGREAVAKLQEAVERNLGELAASAPRIEDATRISALTSTFASIMESAKGGISSPPQLRQLQERLKHLHSQLPGVKTAATTTEAREAVARLEEAVASKLRRLDELEPELEEAERVKELVSRFSSILESARGVGSLSQHREIEQRMNSLRGDIAALRGTLRHDVAKDALEQLSGAVEGNWRTLEEIDRRFRI